MPSLVPGYAYDIFISYRQKDNQYDGWVSEFVSNLQKELAATLKEDLSIYFDQNPHDGLLETHHVDRSLEGKLKCLIFIPIISQTYCDPKSFAWQHEFCAFNRWANSGSPGRDVRLTNGNVASRILPVQIHNLDPGDYTLIEQEIGGVLRPVQFIYQEPGVNRPLRPSDIRHENLNRTDYRNQVNKVANSVKELVQAMKAAPGQGPLLTSPTQSTERLSSRKVRLGIAALIIVGLSLVSLWKLSGLTEKPVDDPAASGIAVLPFKNGTGDSSLDYYGVGIASSIITQFSTSKQFKFISSLRASLSYEHSRSPVTQIGKELGVDYLISGVYRKTGNRLAVEIELVRSANGEALWSFPFEGDISRIDEIQNAIAQAVISRFSSKAIASYTSTNNSDAYLHYVKGKQLMEVAIADSGDWYAPYPPIMEQFRKAIAYDSGFLDAWADLINVECFVFQGDRQTEQNRKSIEDHLRQFTLRFPDSTWQHKMVYGQYAYRVKDNLPEATRLMQEVLNQNPNNEHACYALSTLYRRNLQLEEAARYGSRLVRINPARGTHWLNLGMILKMAGDHKHTMPVMLKGWSLTSAKTFAVYVVETALAMGYPLDQLPDNLKSNPQARYFLALEKHDWKTMAQQARLIPSGANFLLSVMHRLKGNTDSMKYYFRQAYLRKEVDTTTYLLFDGQISRALDNSKPPSEKTPEAMAEFDIQLVMAYLWNKDYPEASRHLVRVVEKYPQLDVTSTFLNHPADKILIQGAPELLRFIQEQRPKEPILSDEDLTY